MKFFRPQSRQCVWRELSSRATVTSLTSVCTLSVLRCSAAAPVDCTAVPLPRYSKYRPAASPQTVSWCKPCTARERLGWEVAACWRNICWTPNLAELCLRLSVGGNFISRHMKIVALEGGRAGRGRVWRCGLCTFQGGESTVALHIHEAHKY